MSFFNFDPPFLLKALLNRVLIVLILFVAKSSTCQSFRVYGNAYGVSNLSSSCVSDTCFTLTPSASNRVGSVFHPIQLNLNNRFDGTFCLYFGTRDANGADGFTFVLKAPGTPDYGNSGGGLGYEGLTPSVGIEFDTWDNTVNGYVDIPEDHTALCFNGIVNTPQLAPIPLDSNGVNIEDGNVHFARIVWEPSDSSLSMYFDGVLRFSYSYNLVDSIFGGNPAVEWGFTSSTGGSYNLQQICFPSIGIGLGPDVTQCVGDTFNLCFYKDNITEYYWYNDNNDTLVSWNTATNSSPLSDTCILVTNSGKYYLSIIHNNFPDIDSISFNFLSYPTEYIAEDTLEFCPDQGSVVITPQNINPSNVYNWTPDGLNTAIITASSEGYHILESYEPTLTCGTRDSVYLKYYCDPEIIMPNIFSPNKDGKNDYFSPLKFYWVGESNFNLFNRWGNLIYNTNNQINWDGTNNNKKFVSDGVYYYIVNYKNKKGEEQEPIHGTVTITR